jgi:hypothetical protein
MPSPPLRRGVARGSLVDLDKCCCGLEKRPWPPERGASARGGEASDLHGMLVVRPSRCEARLPRWQAKRTLLFWLQGKKAPWRTRRAQVCQPSKMAMALA